MASAFHHSALLQDDHLIRNLRKPQTMSDDDTGSALRRMEKGLIKPALLYGIDGGGRLIQKKDSGFFIDSSRDSDLLPLSAGQINPIKISGQNRLRIRLQIRFPPAVNFIKRFLPAFCAVKI